MTTTITTLTTSMRRALLALAAGATLTAGLAGCVPLVVGAAAAGGVGMVATDRRTSGAQLDDEAIELRGGSRVREIAGEGSHVSITSFNRQVLLTGEVPSAALRQQVQDVVARVDNVASVVNDLAVAPPSSLQQRSNDTFITGKVKASLLDARDIFANAYKVVTERNVVYLMGRVTRREADRAADITRGVAGVEKVVRVMEIISEAELSGQVPAGGSGATRPVGALPATAPATGASVALPPMVPLPPAGATPAR